MRGGAISSSGTIYIPADEPPCIRVCLGPHGPSGCTCALLGNKAVNLTIYIPFSFLRRADASSCRALHEATTNEFRDTIPALPIFNRGHCTITPAKYEEPLDLTKATIFAEDWRALKRTSYAYTEVIRNPPEGASKVKTRQEGFMGS